MTTVGRPQRVAAAERADRVLGGLAVPLDGIARLAARQTGTPMAAVCLVSDDEILVGRYGLPEELNRSRRVPLAYSAGKYVVSANAPVLAPDMDADPEYRRSGLRTRFGLRAFLGVPLHDLAGEVVGSIVVGDVVPRPWSEREVATVGHIAEVLDRVPVDSAGDLPPPVLDSGLLLDMVGEGFVALDAGGRIVGWNRASEEMFGWTAAEAVGQRLDRLLHASPAGGDFDSELATRLTTPPGTVTRDNGVVRHRDGRRMEVEVHSHRLSTPNGPVLCDFILDRSAHAESQRDAQRPRSFLDAVLESLRTMVIACDSEANVVLMNRALREFHGLPEDWGPLRVSALTDSVRNADGSPMRAEGIPLTRALHGEQVRDAPVVIQPVTGGEVRAFLVNAQPVIGVDGSRLGAAAALHDITEQRQLERFRAAEIEVVRGLAYASDAAQGGEVALSALAGALGWPYGELWLVEDDLLRQAATWSGPGTEHPSLARPTLRAGEGLAGQVYRQGRLRWVPDLAEGGFPRLAEAAGRSGLHGAVALPVRVGAGVAGVVVLFARPGQNLLSSTKALLGGLVAHLGTYLAQRTVTGLAAALDRSRGDFVTLVGHSLRTPLTSISSYTDLLLADAADWRQQNREMLEVIRRHAVSLRSIVDDLLDLAALESGHGRIRARPVDLVAAVRAAVRRAEALSRSGGVTLSAELPDQLPLVADPERIDQLLDGLLSNAVKYSPGGGLVRVRLAAVGGMVDLRISDEGVGVPAEEHDRLFQRFFRASNAMELGIGGTGLGLARARAIVEAHGGFIAIDSVPSMASGTVVTVRLPLAGPPDAPVPYGEGPAPSPA